MNPKKQDINLTRQQEEDTFQIETSVPNNHLQQMYQEEITKYYCYLKWKKWSTIVNVSPKLTLNTSNTLTFIEENLHWNIKHLVAQNNIYIQFKISVIMKICSSHQILISLYNSGKMWLFQKCWQNPKANRGPENCDNWVYTSYKTIMHTWHKKLMLRNKRGRKCKLVKKKKLLETTELLLFIAPHTLIPYNKCQWEYLWSASTQATEMS